MASFSRALRTLDDVMSSTEQIRRRAQADNLDQQLVRKLKRLESDLDDLKRQLRSLRSDFD